MSRSNATDDIALPRTIEYLSPPAPVSMADQWFEIAALDHFWIRRRFQVLRALAGDLLSNAKEAAEIGCGHGLLQRQIELSYGRSVTGFDLNEYALKNNLSRQSRVCCYDIFRMDPILQESFDLILLFDVLEHISDVDSFLNALLFHLAPEGKLIINVPAGEWAYSEYDVAAGHVRRYAIRTLRETASRNHLKLLDWTYWGLPLVPTLALRKLWLMIERDKSNIIRTGFDSRSSWLNEALFVLSGAESIPQRFLGTSLMAVLGRGIRGE